jgi:RNA 2',3'-cyclic 3'-phosphodiesterase
VKRIASQPAEPAARARRPRERPGRPRTRLFLALELPDPARLAIAGWRDGALAEAAAQLRPVRTEYLHVTLVFLGWQYERDIERIASLAFEAAAGLPPAVLTPVALVPVPKRGPRLFALDLADEHERAGAVQDAASRALAGAHLYEPEKRPFWPHVTLARVKRNSRAPRLDAPAPPAEPFVASRLTLYRSTLRPQGAIYEPLAGHTLA